MADKSFGVKEINLIGASGTPTIESPNNLNINAVNVAISTDASVGNTLSAAQVNVSGVTTATSFKISGGTSSQFLKADGTTDSSTYLTTTGSGANLSNVVNQISAGTGISVNQSTGNVTVTATGGGTADIADYTSEWTLGADGTSSNYTFSGNGFTGAENDPTLYLVRGQKYKFTNNMGSHPFRIQSTVNGSTGTQYNDGIVNNDVSNGTLTWNVQFDAPDTLYYQCTSHPNMGGIIYIIGGAGGATKGYTSGLNSFLN